MTARPAELELLAEHEDQAAKVLFVCTGNVCRSPVAELVLRSQVDESVTVLSAGTRAQNDQPISEPMATVLGENDVCAADASSEPLTESLIRLSDLILTMTVAHRAKVVSLVPSAVRRTFTLLEFARLVGAINLEEALGHSDAERIQRLIPLAIAQRAKLSVQRFNDDVRDPVNRGRSANRKAFQEISQAVTTITTGLNRTDVATTQVGASNLWFWSRARRDLRRSTPALLHEMSS